MSEIISFKSRKPLAEEQAEEAELQKVIDDGRMEAQLDLLDKIRGHVAAGKLDGLVLIARHVETGLFVHDLILPPKVHEKVDAFAWSGAVQAIALEFQDIAQMAPILTPDLEVVSPHMIDEEGILDD